MKFAVAAPAALALALALCAASAAAGTLKVPSEDYPTIQSAVDAAVAGDVVLVGPGEYEEAVEIDGRVDLQIRGKGWPVVRPMGAGPGFSIFGDGSGILVTGFVVDGGLSGVDVRNCADVSIVKLRILNCLLPGVYTQQCNGVLVSRCTITNLDDHGIEDESSMGLVIEKCFVDAFPGDGDGIRLSGEAAGTLGSNGAIVTKNRIERAFTGIRSGGMDAVISKNRIEAVVGGGVLVLGTPDSSGVVVEKNRVTGDVEAGIQSDAPGTVVSRNLLTSCGLFTNGTDAVVDRNRVTGDDDVGFVDYGIVLTGDDTEATGNRVSHVSTFGIQVFGDRVLLQGNAVAGSQEDGIVVYGDDCDVLGNRVSGASFYGFDVIGTGCTITGNRAAGSGLFDLHDEYAEGVNSYEGNRFGTVQFAVP